MPALSYKERFAPFVMGGTKTQTIRAYRKRPFRVGDPLMHYFGLRTKHCMKLCNDTVAREVHTIFILNNGDVFITYRQMSKSEANIYLLQLLHNGLPSDCFKLNDESVKDQLAYDDGFRPNSLQDVRINKKGCFKEMFSYWTSLGHSLPFFGQLIKWNYEGDILPK